MPSSLASQIAAGEVVERPASAVKELVENAIDAGATRIDVEIEGGGVTRLSVADDGHGMSRDDAILCVQRHATSKLFAIDDLSHVMTYGFRGEALPSIAAVSRFSLRTRSAGEDAGTSVEIEGGASPVVRPAGTPVGTTIDVRDLFFNVAPRRKFLRAASTESGHVADTLEVAALTRPDLTFTLTRDGRRVREWLRADSREERVRGIVGEGLAHCTGQRGPLSLEAFLSRPEHARMGAGGLRLMVNSRPVRDRALFHTVAQAYGSVLERGRYPRGVVYLELPPQLVDVNVHPQKGEVRFADPRAVTDAVYQLLGAALARSFSLPAPTRSPWVKAPSLQAGTPAQASVPRAPEGWRVADIAAGELPPSQIASVDEQPSSTSVESSERNGRVASDDGAVVAASDVASSDKPGVGLRWASLRFVAQIRQTYLVCEGQEGLYVIDQHAAAERVNFDRLRKQYRSRAVPSQALLFPTMLKVSPPEGEIVEHQSEALSALGLDLRVRGPDVISVHSVPKLLVRASPEVLVRDLLIEVTRAGARAFSDAVDLALATMACHGSIRAGDRIGENEATALLSALDSVDFAGHCPHGRPVVAVTSFRELERKVGRR